MTIKSSDKIVAIISVRDLEHLKELIHESQYALLLRSSTRQQINKAFECILDGKSFICNELSSLLLENLTDTKKSLKHKIVYESLTAREKEITGLICNSLTTKQIATNLMLSPQTIATHRKNIFRKLDIKNTAALVKYGIKHLNVKTD
jgi:DNA-binding NarL/FixJ family response regulator